MRTYPFVYLTSQNLRRQELLRQLGVSYELLLPRPGEDAEALEVALPSERADDYVVRVCALKTRAAYQRLLDGKHAPAPILTGRYDCHHRWLDSRQAATRRRRSCNA